MSTEEQKPFLDPTNEDNNLGRSDLRRSHINRNCILAISVVSNLVLLTICLLLSGKLLQPTTNKVNSGIPDGIQEPYCTPSSMS